MAGTDIERLVVGMYDLGAIRVSERGPDGGAMNKWLLASGNNSPVVINAHALASFDRQTLDRVPNAPEVRDLAVTAIRGLFDELPHDHVVTLSGSTPLGTVAAANRGSSILSLRPALMDHQAYVSGSYRTGEVVVPYSDTIGLGQRDKVVRSLRRPDCGLVVSDLVALVDYSGLERPRPTPDPAAPPVTEFSPPENHGVVGFGAMVNILADNGRITADQLALVQQYHPELVR